ncbi:phage portal protein [Alicyclobacillus sp. SO9]|uniref:phage portal protein n=1 Tax=Alicyclobacillus sp. SO9 TaxID=2665646 RepID=UPI0018E6E33F|nr:phage portal protein [Alicyclobacillus sp. SO9]QQE80924.1 phage portal protein [Alicyclobacillus sp. SO9]
MTVEIMKASRQGAIASTTSLAAQARMAATKPAAPVKVPETVEIAMTEQGMIAGGNFSPGAPISPYNEVGTPPVITPFQVGQNIFAVPRQMTGVGFDTLKNITSKWDVARLCIEVRQDELRNLDWDIVVDEDEVDNADLYKEEIKQAKKFFMHPAQGYDTDDLVMMSSDDWLRYDALAMYRHRTRNGKLGELEVIDGTSISPLIDGRGGIPRGDAPAYAQWAWGLPWTWLRQRDIIYKPHHPQPSTRYGLPPAEWVLLTANTDVRLQWYFLTYFTEGGVPEAFVNAPPDVQDPKQVKALQDAYDATISGTRGAHHKVKWIPPGAKAELVNKANFDVDFAGFMLAKGCASYKVQPAQIGFTEKVNKSSGDTQRDITDLRSIIPSTKYYQSIFNQILREDFNMPYARFKYLNVEEEEDQLKLAQTRQIYIQTGVYSPDEVRLKLGEEVDSKHPVGRALYTRTGVVFLDDGTAGGVQPDEEDDELEPADGVTVDSELMPKPHSQAKPAEATKKALQNELRKWRNAAVKRAKDGKQQKVWEPVALDGMLAKALNTQLQSVDHPDEVRRLFDPLIGGDAPVNFSKRATNVRRGKGRMVARDNKRLREQQQNLKVQIEILLHREGPPLAQHVSDGLQTQPQAINGTTVELTVLDAILANYGWQGWEKHLKETVTDAAKAIYTQGAEEAMKHVDVQPSFDLINPVAVEYAEKRGAELVGKTRLGDFYIDNPNPEFSIPHATRDMIRRHVVSAIKKGESIDELKKGIQEHYAFSDARAETIARTETGFAYNHGTVGGSGLADVQHVEVFDGDYDPPCADANGSIWTLAYADAHVLQHPNCLVPGTRVVAHNVEATFARRYKGDVVVLRTASDYEVTVTPNHPILTNRGWLTAGELSEGDYVIRDVSTDWTSCGSNHDEMPPVIEEVAESFGLTFDVVPTTAEDFHGDGADGEVCIIRTDGLLSDRAQSTLNKKVAQSVFVDSDILARVFRVECNLFESDGVLDSPFKRLLSATNRVMGRGGNVVTKRVRTLFVGIAKRLGLRAHVDAHVSEPSPDLSSVQPIAASDFIRRQQISDIQLAEFVVGRFGSRSLSAGASEFTATSLEDSQNGRFPDSIFGGELGGALSAHIIPDQVVSVKREFYSGHVYNLQTTQGWYVANSIITHNCVRAFAPIPPDEDEQYVKPPNLEGS